MRIILFLLFSIQLSAQKSGVFEYTNGKIIISKTFLINKNLPYTVKSKMGIYANNYNGGIFQEANKMKDYIIYEDSSLISCLIKFHTSQMFQDAIFQGIAEFQKDGDSVHVSLSKIKVEKVASVLMGDVATDKSNELEIVDAKKFSPVLKKLKERIDYFFALFL